ncbi:MAG: tetratricopeptide repeat protein [Bacteroidales bacterium]|nr:tetratricopeptide repeat protein [Bacteroidales bacterium]
MQTEQILQTIRNLTESEQYIQALETVEALLANEPENDWAWYLKGNIYKKQEQWQQAINSYSQAIAINPANPATTMRRICKDILNFYDKTLYNP